MSVLNAVVEFERYLLIERTQARHELGTDAAASRPQAWHSITCSHLNPGHPYGLPSAVRGDRQGQRDPAPLGHLGSVRVLHQRVGQR